MTVCQERTSGKVFALSRRKSDQGLNNFEGKFVSKKLTYDKSTSGCMMNMNSFVHENSLDTFGHEIFFLFCNWFFRCFSLLLLRFLFTVHCIICVCWTFLLLWSFLQVWIVLITRTRFFLFRFTKVIKLFCGSEKNSSGKSKSLGLSLYQFTVSFKPSWLGLCLGRLCTWFGSWLLSCRRSGNSFLSFCRFRFRFWTFIHFWLCWLIN